MILITPLAAARAHLPAPLMMAAVEFTGCSGPFVLAGLVTFFVALGLAVAVTRRFVAGYRSTGSRPVLWLAVGMFLVALAPMFLRLVFGNLLAVDPTTRRLVTTTAKLAGLLAILWVVYRR